MRDGDEPQVPELEVPIDFIERLGRLMLAGELSKAAALIAVDLAAGRNVRPDAWYDGR